MGGTSQDLGVKSSVFPRFAGKTVTFVPHALKVFPHAD